MTQELVDKVVELRRRTGQPAMWCRRALARCEWDLSQAEDFLKQFGWDSHGFERDRKWLDNGGY
jgi:translation elongation factor EF-Ts